MSMHEITDQIRASVKEGCRAVLESDDAKTVLAFLEEQGYLSIEGIAALEAHASENQSTYHKFLELKGLEIDKNPNVSGTTDDQAAHRAQYVRWLATDEGKKAVADEAAAKAKAEEEKAAAEAKAAEEAEKAAAAEEAAAKKTAAKGTK